MIAKYLRRAPPDEAEARSYNVMQRTAYLVVIFVLFPLVIWTGLAMSPAFDSAVPQRSTRWAAGNPRARCISSSRDPSCSFLMVHVTMVVLSGFRSRMRAMITGRVFVAPQRTSERLAGAPMSPISRRKLITSGLAATAGVAGLTAAVRVAERYGLIPPDHGGIYGPGETLTYAAQRILTAHSLAREFPRSMISKVAFRQRDRASQRSLQAPSGQRLLRLAACGGRHGRPASFAFARRPEKLAIPQPDHRGSVRGGVVLHRGVDRDASD